MQPFASRKEPYKPYSLSIRQRESYKPSSQSVSPSIRERRGSFGFVEALRVGTLGPQGGPKEESREASASLERIWVLPEGSNFFPGAPTGAPKNAKRLKAPSSITSLCAYDNLSFSCIICRFLRSRRVPLDARFPSKRAFDQRESISTRPKAS